jgi:hypothetical protein
VDVTVIVVSGAPGTGKSTVAAALAAHFRRPLVALDMIKEALADVLGTGDEGWSDRLGDAAAEIVFRQSAQFPTWSPRGGGEERGASGPGMNSPARSRFSAAAILRWPWHGCAAGTAPVVTRSTAM